MPESRGVEGVEAPGQGSGTAGPSDRGFGSRRNRKAAATGLARPRPRSRPSPPWLRPKRRGTAGLWDAEASEGSD